VLILKEFTIHFFELFQNTLAIMIVKRYQGISESRLKTIPTAPKFDGMSIRKAEMKPTIAILDLNK